MKIENYWEELCQFLEANRARPLVWGQWDCCQFGAQVVSLLTGVDHAARFPSYDSEAGALRIVAE